MKGKFIALVVTGITLVFTSNIAVAESDSAQKKMRPDVLKVLCERFPLNSRCAGNGEAQVQPTVPENTTAPETNPVETEAPPSTSEPMNEERTAPITPDTQTIPVLPSDNPENLEINPESGDNPENLEINPESSDNPENLENQPTDPETEMAPGTDETTNESPDNMQLETPENTDGENSEN